MLRYSQKGYRMRVKCVIGVFILLITVGGATLAQDDAGKLGFCCPQTVGASGRFPSGNEDAGKRSRND